MPSLDTKLHLKMLAHSKRPVVRRLRMARRILAKQGRWAEHETATSLDRLKAACGALLGPPQIYGLEWGDPEVLPSLRHVRDHFLAPYVTPQATVLEIGPGGGRWTRYLLGAKQVYLVDFHQELLDELARSMRGDHLTMIRNNGSDLPGVPEAGIDFLFSFGCFVHLDLPIVEAYLDSFRAVLKPRGIVVLQYSDKTKAKARGIGTFSQNDPEQMQKRILARGYSIYEEDTASLGHSAIVRFGLSPDDPV
jgi:SAM-dependent methyltransferase